MACIAALAAAPCLAHLPEEIPVTRIAAQKPMAAATADGADTAPRSAAGKPAIGDFGVDLAAGDPQVKPGDDFFAYANGRWSRDFVIPADKASFGPFDRLDELSKERVRGIIARAAAAQAAEGSPEQQIGDHYAAFMDEAAIEAHGLEPARADLERIGAAR